MKKAIINFSNGRYIIGQDRLKQSLIAHGYDGDFIGWQNEQQIGAPPHKANPYAFKTFGFQKAFDMGYDMVMWLDASVVAVANTQPIWDKIENEGYIMQYAGHMCGTWTNDNALRYFKVTRDKAMHYGMYGNAGFLGLNKHDEKAMDFFTQWHQASKVGAFIGNWDNKTFTESRDMRCKGHRHDMSCGSIIANQLKMDMVEGDKWLHYAPPTQQPKDGVILHAQGV
jgi:hypothetical protein